MYGHLNMPMLKPWFLLCLVLAFLSLSSCKSRPLGTPTSLKSTGGGTKDSTFGAHIATLRSWLSELPESPHKTGRLSPEGPDPKHH